MNDNYLKLSDSYLFSDIAKRVSKFTDKHRNMDIIRMGIGDVTRPLPPAVIKALHSATDEMSDEKTFRGYSPDQGYSFLREVIVKNDYTPKGINLTVEEVFVSDGAKSDTGNIGDIFSSNDIVAVCDPVYPVYVDTNAMAGRAGNFDAVSGKWDRLVYMPCTAENNFIPDLPKFRVDLVYLCYPNNPTGEVITKAQLKKWVDYARENEAIILYDAAYEAYITEDNLPHSIYEVEGADEVAIEFRSFSKNAGFTGTRCAFTVIPEKVTAKSSAGVKVSLNKLWARRQSTKYNGAPYIVQRAAEAVYSEEGKEESKALVTYYLENSKTLREGLKNAGFEVYGGVNAPYVWFKTPTGISSWKFFDLLLEKTGIVGTPGSGFGPSGEGYFRLTGFSSKENTADAVDRILKAFK
ncbi:MAG: LL-diaminopimelate aminotransferase [Clostridiales bacterium]|nr:LL-diaminopimelate aminotransferase [Clostridiales bacterium]